MTEMKEGFFYKKRGGEWTTEAVRPLVGCGSTTPYRWICEGLTYTNRGRYSRIEEDLDDLVEGPYTKAEVESFRAAEVAATTAAPAAPEEAPEGPWKAGCFYKTRDGQKAMVAARVDPSPFRPEVDKGVLYVWLAGTDGLWTYGLDGHRSLGGGQHRFDLVGPWVDPPAPRPKLSGWVNYYADEQGGDLHSFRVYTSKERAEAASVKEGRPLLSCVYVQEMDLPSTEQKDDV